MREGIWTTSTETGEPLFVAYDDIDEEVLPQLLKPIGGFCYAADRFLRLPLPEVPFYIKDWLPRQGKMLLYGPGKGGKSRLFLQMSRCIGAGVPFLDIPTTQGRVLYLQFELGPEIFQRRMRETGQTYDNVYVGSTFEMKLDTKAGQKKLTTAIEAVKPSVVLLDPWYKTLRGEEDESHDVIIILDFIDSQIEVFGCSFGIVHHSGKDITKGGRGSSVLVEDWPDSVIELRRTKAAITISPKFLRHAALPEEAMPIMLENFEYVLANHELAAVDKVAEFLTQRGTATVEMMMSEGLGAKRTIHEALSKLVSEGCVVRTSRRGVYGWAEIIEEGGER